MGNENNDQMPAVGSEVTLKGEQYHIESELYHGPFSKVYVISGSCMQYAMKTERTVGSKRSFLQYGFCISEYLMVDMMKNECGGHHEHLND
ncbi:unnamed protein product [Onchocerca flexuosa]|uniref:Protein kinase domain-containing protein n=1 Tax=Onchocerca flexuosa TaxID=387005 RepID=A0A183HCT5_9BILA|nr:unnamed protein product [Onchocerca flexuosa]